MHQSLPALTATTELVRLAEFEIHVGSDSELVLRTPKGDCLCGPEGLAILEAFSRPKPLRDGLMELAARLGTGRQALQDLTNSIHDLYEAGVLRDAHNPTEDLSARPGRFDSPELQISMLEDRTRTQAFLRAIEKTVMPGDIVLDLGTGTGILALAAARAGAAHVYAVEAGHIGRLAQALFQANGMADKITLIPGWSVSVDLPQLADVLVSEILGSRALSERILPITLDARTRLLKPEARLIPERLELWGLPVRLPSEVKAQRSYTPAVLERWRNWYGLDFTPLLQFGAQLVQVEAQSTADWPRLAPPVQLATIDLARFSSSQLTTTVPFQIATAGQFDGFLVYFELEVGAGEHLTTSPTRINPDCHWLHPVWLMPEAWEVEVGQRFQVTYSNASSDGGWAHVEKLS